jgi:hypothetical protein
MGCFQYNIGHNGVDANCTVWLQPWVDGLLKKRLNY